MANYTIRKIGRWTVFDKTEAAHPELKKYISRSRHLLPDSLGDDFVLDKESWYSITPKELADRITQEICKIFPANQKILDLFSGVGGNTISFLKYQCQVTSVENSYQKIRYLQHNVRSCLSSYSLPYEHRVIYGDVYSTETIKKLDKKYDAIVLSPPWGGIEYQKEDPFSLLCRCKVFELENIYDELSDLRIYILPKSIPFTLLLNMFNCSVYNGMFGKRVACHVAVIGKLHDSYNLYPNAHMYFHKHAQKNTKNHKNKPNPNKKNKNQNS
ncbi:trimethylguanosine synthase [Nematocida sp. LUAm3]|nr:trimethylguanosine synthase [Nematocida sp. LUAm3]KAI5176301.1 trimethylguanosine synthase [Nematocida sp. LUAm2]KAI5179227.1 trimethylguanosine synthase [Nematocida sp. LUAm1]